MGSTKKHKHSDCKRRSKHSNKLHSETTERIKDKHRHKKHHKEKKRERNEHKYAETISDDDYDAPPPPKISSHSSPPSAPPVPPPPTIKDDDIKPSGSSNQSLSIEESNKLRARLGLKPLQVDKVESSKSATKGKDNVIVKDSEEFIHKPAENIATKNHQEKIKRKLEEKKEKRHIQQKLANFKTLGESDDEDKDAHSWVKHSRKIQEEKLKAQKREKLFEELDEEFGIGEIIEADMPSLKNNLYNEKHLSGLRVEHNAENFLEGSNVILTLKDQDVLQEDEDVLVNVNMIDDEKYKKNLKTKNQSKMGFNDDEVDEFGNLIPNEILSKYDEEIDGEKKTSFNIGSDSHKELHKQKILEVKKKLKGKLVVSLQSQEAKIASDYYTEQEMVKFKKPKKKVRKIRRKKLSAQDLEDLTSSEQNPYKDLGSRRSKNTNEFVKVKQEPKDDDDPMEIDDIPEPSSNMTNITIEHEDEEMELQMALDKARRLRQREELKVERPLTPALEIAEAVNNSDSIETGSMPQQSSICLNATAEFCRTLGDIPTYGLSGNRDDDGDVLMDFQYEVDNKRFKPDNNVSTSWNEVEAVPPSIEEIPKEVRILDAEPNIGTGVAGALKLALSKGYLEKEDQNKPSASRFAHLQAQNYSIEDKSHGDDDKFGRRDRYSGPTTDFKEKDGFKPNVKLDYIDDDGHVLSAKEAFRYLSHKFHGKGPGKNKIEKRMKKNEQEGLMKQMSSTDTPLGTLNLLQQKQKETQSAFIVLSGSKQTTSISKSKH